MNKKCFKCNTENPFHAKYCRRCGGKFDEKPEIVDFRLNAVCRVGDVVDFSWDVANADKVTLNGIVVTDKTHFSVTIKGDEVYKLIARKGKNKIERIITIHPQKTVRDKETEPKPTPVPIGSILKHKKWTVMISLLVLTVFFVVLINDTIIPSYFNISYSGWQKIKPVIFSLCIVIMIFNVGSIIYSIVRNAPKEFQNELFKK